MKDRLFNFSDRAALISVYLLIIAIPISNALIESIFGVLFMFFLLKKISRPDFKFMKSYIYLLLFSFLFFSCLSLFNSGPFIKVSLRAFFLKWMECLAIFTIVNDTISNNQKRIRNCGVALVTVSLIICFDAVIQKFTGNDFFRYRPTIPLAPGKSVAGLTASFDHYNSFGSYLVFSLPFFIAATIAAKKLVTKISLAAAVFLMLVCLVLSFSRGAWLGFLSSAVLLFILARRKIYLFLVILTFVLAVAILSPGAKDKDMLSNTGRLPVWQGTLQMIKNHPILGIGVGTYMSNYHTYFKNTPAPYAHNSYLQIWAESGIFSLISFLCFLFLLMHKGVMAFKKYQNTLVLGLTCGIFGFLIHSFVDVDFYSLQLSALFWLGAGMLNASAESA